MASHTVLKARAFQGQPHRAATCRVQAQNQVSTGRRQRGAGWVNTKDGDENIHAKAMGTATMR